MARLVIRVMYCVLARHDDLFVLDVDVANDRFSVADIRLELFLFQTVLIALYLPILVVVHLVVHKEVVIVVIIIIKGIILYQLQTIVDPVVDNLNYLEIS